MKFRTHKERLVHFRSSDIPKVINIRNQNAGARRLCETRCDLHEMIPIRSIQCLMVMDVAERLADATIMPKSGGGGGGVGRFHGPIRVRKS